MTTSASRVVRARTSPSATMSPGESLGVVLVHLAAKGPNREGFGRRHALQPTEARVRLFGPGRGSRRRRRAPRTRPTRTQAVTCWLSSSQPIRKAIAGLKAKRTPTIEGFSRRSACSSAPKPSTIDITATMQETAQEQRMVHEDVRRSERHRQGHERGDRHRDRESAETHRSSPRPGARRTRTTPSQGRHPTAKRPPTKVSPPPGRESATTPKPASTTKPK